MSTLVSIIVPLYNHEKFIVKCIESIVSEAIVNSEIIIIDDGSIDNSKQVVLDWLSNNVEHKHVKFLVRENRGLSKTLNELILMAKGKYIKFIASDDYILPGGLRGCIDFLENNLEYDAVFGDAVIVDNSNMIVSESCLFEFRKRKLASYIDPVLLKNEIIQRWSVPGPVSCIRRDFILKVGLFDEDLVIEDWDLFLRMLSFGKIGFINEKVAAYRHHESNVSRSTNVERRIKNLSDMVKTLDKNIPNFTAHDKNALVGMRELYEAKISYLRGDIFAGVRHLLFFFLRNVSAWPALRVLNSARKI